MSPIENQAQAISIANILNLHIPSGFKFNCTCSGCAPLTKQIITYMNNTPLETLETPEDIEQPDENIPKELQHLTMLINAVIEGNPTAKTLLSNYAKSLYEIRNTLITLDPFQIAQHDELWHKGYETGLKDGIDKIVVTEELYKEVQETINKKLKAKFNNAIVTAFEGTRITHIKRALISKRMLHYMWPEDPNFNPSNI